MTTKGGWHKDGDAEVSIIDGCRLSVKPEYLPEHKATWWAWSLWMCDSDGRKQLFRLAGYQPTEVEAKNRVMIALHRELRADDPLDFDGPLNGEGAAMTCPDCKGDGRVTAYRKTAKPWRSPEDEVEVECDTCEGTGKVEDGEEE